MLTVGTLPYALIPGIGDAAARGPDVQIDIAQVPRAENLAHRLEHVVLLDDVKDFLLRGILRGLILDMDARIPLHMLDIVGRAIGAAQGVRPLALHVALARDVLAVPVRVGWRIRNLIAHGGDAPAVGGGVAGPARRRGAGGAARQRAAVRSPGCPRSWRSTETARGRPCRGRPRCGR